MNKNKSKNFLVGQVVSSCRNKTVAVRIDRRVKHPLYGKIITKSNKLHAHDENNQCKVGDVVTIYETRPISKTKTWQVFLPEN